MSLQDIQEKLNKTILELKKFDIRFNTLAHQYKQTLDENKKKQIKKQYDLEQANLKKYMDQLEQLLNTKRKLKR